MNMDTQHTLLDGAERPQTGDRTFFYLLSAYFLPRGLFLDPEAQGAWSRWARRRHNLAVLRRYSLTFARRWAALWILGSAPGMLIGGALGSILMLVPGLALMPAVVFVCAWLAADIAGDDLPL